MTVSVIDSAHAMRQILTAPADERVSLVREMWAPFSGMYHFVPRGVDMADIHRQNFGFDWERPTDQLQEGLDRLIEADAWSRVAGALEAGISALVRAGGANGLPDAPTVPDLMVLLLLGDPSNSHLLDEVQGLSAFGGLSGYIIVTVWPTPLVLERL